MQATGNMKTVVVGAVRFKISTSRREEGRWMVDLEGEEKVSGRKRDEGREKCGGGKVGKDEKSERRDGGGEGGVVRTENDKREKRRKEGKDREKEKGREDLTVGEGKVNEGVQLDI